MHDWDSELLREDLQIIAGRDHGLPFPASIPPLDAERDLEAVQAVPDVKVVVTPLLVLLAAKMKMTSSRLNRLLSRNLKTFKKIRNNQTKKQLSMPPQLVEP